MQRSIRFPVDVNGARESSVLNSLCLARSRFHTGQKRRGISVEGKGGGWTKMIWFVINCCHNKYNAFLFFFKVFNIYVYTLEENYNNSKKAKFELKSNTVSTSARVILLHNGREWSWFIHIFPTWLHVDQIKTKRHKHIYFNYYVYNTF